MREEGMMASRNKVHRNKRYSAARILPPGSS